MSKNNIINLKGDKIMELKNSKTEKNLLEAFAGESMATNRYSYFASRAKKDGFEQIAKIFTETSLNERAHAKIWFNYLKGVKNTEDNLVYAMEGENYEYTTMYKEFARVAREEGFIEIAERFQMVGDIEKMHEDRYGKYLFELKNGLLFEDKEETYYICSNCGHIHYGKKAPNICPVCYHSQAFFEKTNENFDANIKNQK